MCGLGDRVLLEECTFACDSWFCGGAVLGGRCEDLAGEALGGDVHLFGWVAV